MQIRLKGKNIYASHQNKYDHSSTGFTHLVTHSEYIYHCNKFHSVCNICQEPKSFADELAAKISGASLPKQPEAKGNVESTCILAHIVSRVFD